MKKVIIGILVFVGILFSCQEEENSLNNEEIQDLLENTKLIGDWKLESRSIDNITSLAVECCDFLEFRTDSIKDDYIGKFFAHGVGYQAIGIFEVDIDSSLVNFIYDSGSHVYYYESQDSSVYFRYQQNGQLIEENWIKE